MGPGYTEITMNERLTEKIAKIKEHLAEGPNNRIILRTQGHNTVYSPKHANLFVAEDAQGIYVKHGKKNVYYFADAVKFAHLEIK
jgi:hypothetical protein